MEKSEIKNVLRKLNLQFYHERKNHRIDHKIKKIGGHYVVFVWYNRKNGLRRLVFGDWKPIAFLSLANEKPWMLFCYATLPYLIELKELNNRFPNLKIDNLEIDKMSAVNETIFHRLFWPFKI